MLNAWKEILTAEAGIIVKYRARGRSVIRLSSVLIALFAIMYLISDIDLIPERIIQPSLFAYVDDMVIALFAGYFVYKDVEEVFVHEQDKVQSGILPEETRRLSEADLPVDVDNGNSVASDDSAVASDDVDLRGEHPDVISGGVDRLVANGRAIDLLHSGELRQGDTSGSSSGEEAFDLDAFFRTGDGDEEGSDPPKVVSGNSSLQDFFK